MYIAVMQIVLYAFACFFGLCVFSFLNVLIYRVPRELEFVRGRSMCPGCGHQLQAVDLVPVLSWTVLHGRCRYCDASISMRYTAVELLGALFAVLCVVVWGWTPAALVGFALCALMTTITFIDIDTQTIPNGLVLAVAVLGIIGIFVPIADITLLDRAIGIIAVSVPMLLIAMFTGGFGGGDIKLMAALGLLLGWQLALLTFFGGVLLGGIYAIGLLIGRKAGRKDAFAFGPFLCVCAIISSMYGSALIKSYLALFGLG